jgi:hypothetical protein
VVGVLIPVFGRHDVYCLEGVVIIRKGLSHTHEHNVGYRGARVFGHCSSELSRNLGYAEVPFKPFYAGETELAPECAADLRRHAQCMPSAHGYEYGFYRRAVVQSELVLCRMVAADLFLPYLQGGYFELLCEQTP